MVQHYVVEQEPILNENVTKKKCGFIIKNSMEVDHYFPIKQIQKSYMPYRIILGSNIGFLD